MKNISVILFSILIGISIGCSKKDFPREETLINIYYENKELLNSIKDGFLSSGYSFPNGSDIFLCYDYKNKQLFCEYDTSGEQLKSIQNVHSDAIEFFTRINKSYADISFMKFRNMDDGFMVRFSFGSSVTYQAYILHTNTPEKVFRGSLTHIEDNWYVNRFKFTE